MPAFAAAAAAAATACSKVMPHCHTAGNFWGCLLIGLLLAATTAVAAAAAAAGAEDAAAPANVVPQEVAGSNVRLFVQALLQLTKPGSSHLTEAATAAAAASAAEPGSDSSSSRTGLQCDAAWCVMFRYRLREFLAAVLLLLRCMLPPALRQQRLQAALLELHDVICTVSMKVCACGRRQITLYAAATLLKCL
jgi:hypothetical protein